MATPQRRVTRSQSRELDDPNYGKQSSKTAQRHGVQGRAQVKRECYMVYSFLTSEPRQVNHVYGRPCYDWPSCFAGRRIPSLIHCNDNQL